MEENKKSKIEATIKTMLYKQAKDKITKEEEELSYRKLHNLLEYKLKKENKPIPNGLSYATNYYFDTPPRKQGGFFFHNLTGYLQRSIRAV